MILISGRKISKCLWSESTVLARQYLCKHGSVQRTRAGAQRRRGFNRAVTHHKVTTNPGIRFDCFNLWQPQVDFFPHLWQHLATLLLQITLMRDLRPPKVIKKLGGKHTNYCETEKNENENMGKCCDWLKSGKIQCFQFVYPMRTSKFEVGGHHFSEYCLLVGGHHSESVRATFLGSEGDLIDGTCQC